MSQTTDPAAGDRSGGDIPPVVPGHSSARWVRVFDHFAGAITRRTGSPVAFGIAILAVIVWASTGPWFRYSETWQLIINTGTTIITFLMVFLIQQSQNKDSAAIHLKLNELFASHRAASNSLVSIEDLDEGELQELRAFYRRLAELSDETGDLSDSHSRSAAERLHSRKKAVRDQVAAETGKLS